jgi:hypothetical protein
MSLPTRLAITEWPTQDAPDMYMEQYVTVDHMNGQLIQAAAERDAVQKKLDDTNLQLRNMQPSWDRYDFLRLNLATVGWTVAR